MVLKLYVRMASWLDSEEGAAGVEYALLIALIAIAVATGAGIVGPKIEPLFQAVADKLHP